MPSRTATHCAEPLPRPAQAAMCWTLTVILAAMALFAPRFVSVVATTAVAAARPAAAAPATTVTDIITHSAASEYFHSTWRCNTDAAVVTNLHSETL